VIYWLPLPLTLHATVKLKNIKGKEKVILNTEKNSNFKGRKHKIF
jgi:hypothetical protein